MGANTHGSPSEIDSSLNLRPFIKGPQAETLEELDCEEMLRMNAERVAELVLCPEGAQAALDDATLVDFSSIRKNPQSGGSPSSPTRPEWQKICIQHSVCIHNIYGNCAYAENCYYHHLEDFKKPDLLFKTELCRYGVECVNRPRCCFAHNKKERRTPEQNVRDALVRNHIHLQHQGAAGQFPPQQQQQPQQQQPVVPNPIRPTPQLPPLPPQSLRPLGPQPMFQMPDSL